jgi:hypothetical protein
MANPTYANENLQGQAPAKSTDEKLDQAIEDSFPASDPVQLAMPHKRLEGSRKVSPYAAGGIGLLAIAGIIAAAYLYRRDR